MTDLEKLNPKQREAVTTTEGPVLVLAGAGSGKTRALTYRIAYLIDEKHVKPWNILAITFTNKAAGEMKERVEALVPEVGSSIWVATFHSTCVRILRRFIDRLGYENNFTIYDTDDQKTLLKQVMKRLDIDPKLYKERAVLSAISDAKNKDVSPEEMSVSASGDYRKMQIAAIYTEYQAQLRRNNALDFDDLLCRTVELFESAPDVLEYYQEKFRYILVDEYQDTNGVQFRLVEMLARRYRNVCVVGDDDQSIYKFRGADIRNILDFEKAFPGAKVIKLEQNYRSTQTILDAANGVIANNRDRKDKHLWTQNDHGHPIRVITFDTACDEAAGIVKMMEDAQSRGIPLGQCAVLYRTNAQSRVLEEKCVTMGLPYRLVGGVNFYQRREIKDILAYLRTLENGADDIAAARILNVPKRGIGAATQAKVEAFAAEEGISFFDALLSVEAVPGLGRAAGKIRAFADLMLSLRKKAASLPVSELIDAVMEETGMKREIEENEEATEAQSRLENVEELRGKALEYEEQQGEEATLSGFLEEVSLVADVDSLDENEERLTLMTLHSAKGLEFDKVVLAGMEDGLFPGFMSINDIEHPEELEEERRLAYVGITRARKELALTMARQRMVNGETRYSKISRFVDEIPEGLLHREDKTVLYSPRPSAPSYRESPRAAEGYGGRKLTTDIFDLGPRPKTPYGASFGKPFEVQRTGELPYHAGDRVRHIKFGEGKVLSMEDGPKDTEVTVEFDRAGIKKMYASFAKLKKIEP